MSFLRFTTQRDVQFASLKADLRAVRRQLAHVEALLLVTALEQPPTPTPPGPGHPVQLHVIEGDAA